MWKAVKKIKLKTSLDKPCGHDRNDGLFQGLYTEKSDRFGQVTAIEMDLGIESSELRFENITREYLQTALEMFVYLIQL